MSATSVNMPPVRERARGPGLSPLLSHLLLLLLPRAALPLVLVGPPYAELTQGPGYAGASGICAGPNEALAPGSSIASAFLLDDGVNDRTLFPRGAELAFANVAVALNGADPVREFNVTVCADSGSYAPCGPTVNVAWYTAPGTASAGPGPATFTTITASFPTPFYKLVHVPALGSADVYWLVLTYTGSNAATPPVACVGNGLMACDQNRPDRCISSAVEFEPNERFFKQAAPGGAWTKSPTADNRGIFMGLYQPSPTPSASPSAAATRSGTASSSATATATSSAASSASAKASASAAGSASAAATASSSASSSASASSTASSTATATATATGTATATATASSSSNATVPGANAAAPDAAPAGLVAGAASGVALLLLAAGGAYVYCVLLPQYRAGTGPFAGRAARHGPKQEKDRSIARRIAVRRASAGGATAPKGHHASKHPEALRADALANMASAYDEVYGAGVPADPAAAAASAAAVAAAARNDAAVREGLGRPAAPAAAPAPAPAAVAAPAPALGDGAGEWGGSRRGLSKSSFAPRAAVATGNPFFGVSGVGGGGPTAAAAPASGVSAITSVLAGGADDEA